MNKFLVPLVLAALSSPGLQAQLPARVPFVRTSGTASVFVSPDQVIVDASVMTQAMTAQDAASQDATQVANVLAALGKLLGSGADIKTVNYYVAPVYKYPPNGGTPTLTGYSATNTIEITLNMLNLAGAVIDTATQAGATSVAGLRFALTDSEPSRLQALKTATAQAKSHADAIAGALGKTVGTVVSIEEGSTVSVQPLIAGIGAGAAAPTTPVEPGLIQVQASVVLQADLN
jgi:uncharacterized protein YggE